jgi:hypothetical protein
MFVDFIINGQADGIVANRLQEMRYDPNLMRPYIDEDGQAVCTVNTGRKKRNEETGKMEPVFAVHSLQELMQAGIHSPVFNATRQGRP